MALSPSLRAPVQWRTLARPHRAPLAAVIPAVDALALFGAAKMVGRLEGVLLAYMLVSLVVLATTGTHRARINPSLADDFASLMGLLVIPFILVAPLAASDSELGHFVRIAPIAMAFVLLGRGVAYMIVREARARGFISEPTLIVGAGVLGAKAARVLQEHPEFGLVPVGFVDSFDDTGLPAPMLGDVNQLEAVVRKFGVQRVIVAFGGTREQDLVPLLRQCDQLPVEVHIMPRFFELGVAKEGPFTDDLRGIPLIRLRRAALRTAAWRTKRIFDLIVGSLILVASAPVFAACAFAVRLSSPGPVFFKQDRIGQRGQVFECLKFRTLRQNDDSDTCWNVGDDARRTKVGAIMRRTSLDELPQLINVLRGEMSLVGPRPERPYFVDQFRVAVPGYDDRHRVPVGITGWAQVHGLRGDTSIQERAAFDNNYVENWSLWRDLVILLRTLGAVVAGEGS